MSKTSSTMPRNRMTLRLWCYGLVAALGSSFASMNAVAYQFQLSEAEFAQWSEFCKLAYIGTPPGRKSIHTLRYTREDIKAAWEYARSHRNGPWHFCAGITLMNRATALPAGKKRTSILGSVYREAQFTFGLSRPGDDFWSLCGVLMARSLLERDMFVEAENLLRKIVSLTPEHAPAYEAWYLIYKRTGRPVAQRIAMLENGDAASNGQSAQLQYFLGLEYLAAGRLDDAQAQADKAYAKGYPLPGLRRRLAASGRAAGS